MNIKNLLWLWPWLLLAVPTMAEASHQDNTQKAQIQSLLKRIDALEQAQQIAKTTENAPINAANTAENTGNPSISVIGSFAGSAMRSSQGRHRQSFLPLSEGEFVFAADVDAYTRLDVTVTAANGGMAVEEGYVTSRLPQGFRLRAGRIFMPLGLANAKHPHALVYVDRPNGLVNLFGAEKLIGEGIFIDRPFYLGDSAQSLLLGFFQSANPVLLNPLGSNHLGGMLHWTGMWDLNENSTFELGSTFSNSSNGIAANSRTSLFGLHFSIKNSDIKHRGWALQGEWNRSQIHQGIALPNKLNDGSYLLGEYHFNRHWLTFSRYDLSFSNASPGHESAYSIGIGWKPSEFQSLSLQYKRTQNALAQTATKLAIGLGQNAHEVLFRWVAAIGPHRPHSY